MAAIQEVSKYKTHLREIRESLYLPGVFPKDVENVVTDPQKASIVLAPFLIRTIVICPRDLRQIGQTFIILGNFKNSSLHPKIAVKFEVDDYLKEKKVSARSIAVSSILDLSGLSFRSGWTYAGDGGIMNANFFLECDASGFTKTLVNRYFPEDKLRKDLGVVLGKIADEILKRK